MKAKLVAVMSVLFLLCGVAFAQSYQIRTDNIINLRNGYSLSDDIVETVPAGTILQVVGKFNRWLKIDRNGSEVWMADWVAHTRIQGSQEVGSPQPATGSQSEVDNCCFVDRQCSTEDQWVSGYFAFQNNQCNVPPTQTMQSQPQVSSQPAEIDNLCYTVRTCYTPQDWLDGYYAFQAQQGQVSSSSQQQASSQQQVETQPQVTYVRNCTHARQLGIAPVYRGDPGYRRALDRDNDGIGCE